MEILLGRHIVGVVVHIKIISCIASKLAFCFNKPIFVTKPGKTGLMRTFCISRNTNLKY